MANNSKSEIIIAVFVGLTTGLAFSYLLYALNKKPVISKRKQTVEKVTSLSPFTTKKSMDQKAVIAHLTILSPIDKSIVSSSKITITGQSPKNSTIILLSENEEKIMEMTSKENFQIETNLVDGENQLNLTAILKNDQEETVNLTVIYQKAE